MWLYLITIVAAIFGAAAAFAGLGPVAIILLVGAIAMVVARIVVNSRGGGSTDPGTPEHTTGGTMSSTGGRGPGGDAGPQDTKHVDKAHVKTGVAHPGQAHMVPDQEQPAS
jgi:hypothetical protein